MLAHGRFVRGKQRVKVTRSGSETTQHVVHVAAILHMHAARSALAPRLFQHYDLWVSRTNYGTAKKKRPGYLVGNLVATNWPIEKALHAIGYNQIPTK